MQILHVTFRLPFHSSFRWDQPLKWLQSHCPSNMSERMRISYILNKGTHLDKDEFGACLTHVISRTNVVFSTGQFTSESPWRFYRNRHSKKFGAPICRRKLLWLQCCMRDKTSRSCQWLSNHTTQNDRLFDGQLSRWYDRRGENTHGSLSRGCASPTAATGLRC
jgi:hypothetical protein